MGFILFSAGCSEGFLVAAIDLNRLGGSGEPPLPMYSQRVVLGFFVGCWVEVCSGGALLFGARVIAIFTDQVNNYFLLFLGAGHRGFVRIYPNEALALDSLRQPFTPFSGNCGAKFSKIFKS